jgi:ribosomal protein L11 methylase PrmA
VAQRKQAIGQPKIKFSKQKLQNLISSLEILVRHLHLPTQKSAWSGYYDEASQRSDYLEKKRDLIDQWLGTPGDLHSAVDLGSNNGEFSRQLSGKNIQTLSADFDPYCINTLYLEIKKSGEKKIQPLIIDLADPSPTMGVNNKERASFSDRTRVDLSLALALIHHLAIGKNIPFELIASFLSPLSKHLIIEFVPKADEKVQLMLSGKKDIYVNYDESHFEQAFKRYYNIVNKENIAGSGRILYLMTRS